MEALRLKTTVGQNGRIIVENLPFQEGDEVEIVVSEVEIDRDISVNPYPLRGTPYRYDDPFGPAVPPEDWEALQ
jgi:hypothetical protein